MVAQNHSTVAASLQAAQDAFTDIADLLLGAEALISQHEDADGDLLAPACNILRQIRCAADAAGDAADARNVAFRRSMECVLPTDG